MLTEPYFLKNNPSKITNSWELKKVLALELFKRPALRSMQPNLIEARSKLDLMLFEGHLGIRGKTLDDGSFDFFPINNPDNAKKQLVEQINLFTENPPPIHMAQVRFRISADNKFGIWLDCSHDSIDELINESNWLKAALSKGWIIEFGQKHQSIALEDSLLITQKATPQVWLESFDKNNQSIPLQSFISSFSQPGAEANRAIIACLFDLLDLHNVETDSWCEWGAGYGNLTAAMASYFPNASAWSSESDPACTTLLKQNSFEHFSNVKTEQQSAKDWNRDEQLLLIDPPRSGFSELITNLVNSKKQPQWIVALHCHHRGLGSDLKLLFESNYQLQDWSCIDIFPATPHMEHLSLWKLL